MVPTRPPTRPPKIRTLNLTVGFATGSAILGRANQADIKGFVKEVILERRRLISVSGYASPEGPLGENSSLVLQRAAVVSNFVRQTLGQDKARRVMVRTKIGGIKRSPSQSQDQVATLSA